MRTTPKITMVSFCLLFLFACAQHTGLVKSTYKMLAVSETSYDTGMKVAAGLYAQKRITEEQKAEIIEKGRVFVKAHNAAVDTLADYVETGNMEDQARVEAQIAIASKALIALLEIIEPYILER